MSQRTFTAVVVWLTRMLFAAVKSRVRRVKTLQSAGAQ